MVSTKGAHSGLQTVARRAVLAALVVAIAVGIVFLWQSETIDRALDAALKWAAALIKNHPTGGVIVFVMVAGLSAMLAFFSAALLVPAAAAAWGKLLAALLLWAGWMAGGAVAYVIGRFLGRSVVKRIASKDKLARYDKLITARSRWWMVFVFQLAVPSEIPGYLAGLTRYRFGGYLLALGLAELPYAVGSVYLGESFRERNVPVFLGITVASGVFITLTWYVLRRRLGGDK